MYCDCTISSQDYQPESADEQLQYEQLQAIDATEEGFHLPRGCLLALFPLCTDRSEDLQTLRLGPPGSLA